MFFSKLEPKIPFVRLQSHESLLSHLMNSTDYFINIAQLVEQRTGNVEVTGSNPVEALIFFQASSFQLLKLENLLR